MRDVLDDIRRGCARVSAEATWVHIDRDRLAQYADELPLHPPFAIADPARARVGDDEATASFVLSLDAINFGSGYFPHLRKRPAMAGYLTIATSLQDHTKAHGPLTTADLRAMTTERCMQIFDQPHDQPLAVELMGHFARAWRNLGDAIDQRHGGSFSAFVLDAHHSAATLVTQLAQIDEFRDVATYRGHDVPLFKRAQITAFDLAEAFGHQGLGRFDDIHRLTMFADNLVPHVLRVDGVLKFNPELVARIERNEEIPSGSEPEVEIRAVAVHAVELMVDHRRASGHAVSAGSIDAVLWNRGADNRYRQVRRHRTLCVFY